MPLFVRGAFELWFGADLPESSRDSEGCLFQSVRGPR